MEVNDDCWCLAQHCARWASENQHPNVRNAFLSMANAWSQLVLQQEGANRRQVALLINGKAALAVPDSLGISERLRSTACSTKPMIGP
jgi:hypothetical protein